MRKATQRSRPARGRLITSAAITTVAGLVVASGVLATVSFRGQGRVDFDRIRTSGLTVTGTAVFNGTLENTTTSKPLYLKDNVRVSGKIWRGGTAGPGDNVPVLIDDKLDVAGDIVFASNNTSLTGWLNGQSDWNDAQSDVNDARYTNIAHIVDFLECVTTFAQSTTYLWSSDEIFCWNTHIAGNTFPTSQGSGKTGEGTVADEVAESKTYRGPEQPE